jgi:catechol 2,3-dioxygenase-like lactoylglutathione lyase family enzyme
MTLDAIGIVSADAKKAVEFYHLLGVELKMAGEHEHYEAQTPSGVRVMLDSVDLIRRFEPGFQMTPGTGPVLCFKQASAARVDALYAAVIAAGFRGRKPPWDAFWGQRYACVLDPDGNQIDLFATL